MTLPSRKYLYFMMLSMGAMTALHSSQLLSQVGAAGLAERMSQKDFDASGLGKLTTAELAHLDAWLAGRPIVVNTDGRASTEPVFYADDSKREVIQTNISGTFSGWSGKTTFAMDNDQVWQQAQSGSLGDFSLNGPAVRIRPMMMGGWLMYVDGCGCSVRVKRIK